MGDVKITLSESVFKLLKEVAIHKKNNNYNMVVLDLCLDYLKSIDENKQRNNGVYDSQVRACADELKTAKSETPIPASSGREKGEKEK